MMLWITFAALACLAAVLMLYPIRRAGGGTDRDAGAVAVLSDQLREVDRDAERGLISPAEAEAARTEIKRRLLKLGRRQDAGSASTQSGRAALWISAAAVPLLAALFYAGLGAPGIPSMSYADRQEERADQVQIADLTDRLRERLESDPEGGPTAGWMLLGQTYMRTGRYGDAAAAMETVIERQDASSAMVSQFAEALVAAENGIVTPRARAAIRRAREMDPTNPAATYYEALALDQAGDSAEAHDLLIARLEQAGGPVPWMEPFIAQANRIGERLGRAPVSLATFDSSGRWSIALPRAWRKPPTTWMDGCGWATPIGCWARCRPRAKPSRPRNSSPKRCQRKIRASRRSGTPCRTCGVSPPQAVPARRSLLPRLRRDRRFRSER